MTSAAAGPAARPSPAIQAPLVAPGAAAPPILGAAGHAEPAAHAEPELSRGDLTDPARLLGAWRFERTIDDRHDGRRIHVAGTATFAPRSDGVIAWDEEGILDQGADRVPVEAHRLLRRGDAGDWQVEFGDGRPFHPWRLDTEIVHDCEPDDYRGRIDTEGGVAAWTQTWNVSGPSKDYTMVTRYEPWP